MSEINASEQIARIFAQAQKLMIARQTAITAQVDAELAEAELIRLHGSTNIDLSHFERVRYFTCDGPSHLKVLEDQRQEAGAKPSDAVAAQCANVISFSSWEIDTEQKRPKEAPICHGCRQAIARATPPKPAEEAPKPQLKAVKK